MKKEEVATVYPKGSEEEAIALFIQMKEAEEAFQDRPKRNLTPEELNAAFAQMKDTPVGEDKDTSVFNPVSALILGGKGDEAGDSRPKNHIQLRNELLNHPSFNDTRDMKLFYEELVARKAAGEQIYREDLTNEEWLQLWYVEGIEGELLSDLFDGEVETPNMKRGLREEVDVAKENRLRYLRMKTQQYKINNPHLTVPQQTNYQRI